jgi:hypothetical protein
MGSNFYRQGMYKLVNTKIFTYSILSIIMLNTVMMALQTMESVHRHAGTKNRLLAYNRSHFLLFASKGWYIFFLDDVFLGIYLFEAMAKIYVYRKEYFNAGWNIFGILIILLNTLSLSLLQAHGPHNNSIRFRHRYIKRGDIFVTGLDNGWGPRSRCQSVSLAPNPEDFACCEIFESPPHDHVLQEASSHCEYLVEEYTCYGEHCRHDWTYHL